MKTRSAIMVSVVLGLAAMMMLACQTKEVTSAKVYIQQDNWDKAIEQLEIAVQTYPNDPEAHYLLGEGYGNQARWEEMNQMFTKSLEIGPKFEPQIKATVEKHWVTTFNGGVNRINGGDLDGAIKQFETCLVIDPNREEAYKNLAVSQMQKGDLEGARDTYLKLREKNPEDVEVIHALANTYFQLKNYDEVVKLESRAVELNPDDIDAVINLALAYDFLGQTEKAMSEYSKALEKNPDEKDLIFNLGRLYYMNDDYEKAIELFERAIKANPDDYDANLNVGNAYLSMGDNLRKTLVEKENENQQVTQEELDQLKELYNKAIPYLEKAVEVKGDDPNVWNNLGVAYVNVGDADKGKECFDKAESLR